MLFVGGGREEISTELEAERKMCSTWNMTFQPFCFYYKYKNNKNKKWEHPNQPPKDSYNIFLTHLKWGQVRIKYIGLLQKKVCNFKATGIGIAWHWCSWQKKNLDGEEGTQFG